MSVCCFYFQKRHLNTYGMGAELLLVISAAVCAAPVQDSVLQWAETGHTHSHQVGAVDL